MAKKLEIIKEDARELNLLILSTSEGLSELNSINYEELFKGFVVKNSPQEAYLYFRSNAVDMIVIDFDSEQSSAMGEFMRKVRERDSDIQIILMSEESSCRELSELLFYGVGSLLIKPFTKEQELDALHRSVALIHERKLLEFYVNQLEAITKESIARKSAQLKQKKSQQNQSDVEQSQKDEPIQSDTLVDKYKIRNSVNEMENIDVNELDMLGSERIQHFRENIIEYESKLCSVDHKDTPALRAELHKVLEGLRDLVRTINVLGVFSIASNAAVNLIEFVENLEDSAFEDEEKRELFLDILISMMGDFDRWINLVFIEQTAQNIHYFDASFANTCLELEMIFKDTKSQSHKEDEETLEFF